MDDILAQRQKDVAARSPAPDPFEERVRRDVERQRQLAALRAAPEPSPADGEAEGGDPHLEDAAEDARPVGGGYRVEQSGTWFSLIGPDGEKVGKSQRSEADAWALLEEE